MPSKLLESDVMRRSYSSTCDVKRENSKNCPYLVLNCEPPLTWINTAFRHVRHGDLFYENYIEFGRPSQQRSFQLCLIVKIPVFWHKSTTTATEKQERRLPLTFFKSPLSREEVRTIILGDQNKNGFDLKIWQGYPLDVFSGQIRFCPRIESFGP